jgi:hypothetical protein
VNQDKQSPYFNCGKNQQPQLLATLNLLTISGLPHAVENNESFIPKFKHLRVSSQQVRQAKKDGFLAMQSHLLLPSFDKAFFKANFICTQAAKIKNTQGLEKKVARWKAKNYSCATLIIGSGYETTEQILAEVDVVNQISLALDFPLYIELHRASITEDIETTLTIIKHCPETKFNADFSHYITCYKLDQLSASELKACLDIMQPIFQRVVYFHGRFASSNNIQTPKPQPHQEALYFLLVDQVFTHFHQNSRQGDVLFFAAELLPRMTGYSYIKRSPAGHHEDNNRYKEALVLNKKAQQYFQRSLSKDALSKNSLSKSFSTKKSDIEDIINSAHYINKQQKTITADEVLLSISNSDELNNIKHSLFNGKKIIRVSLGSYLIKSSTEQQLIDDFIQWQQQDPRIVLETSRNSLCHNLATTKNLLKNHPNLRLSLNVSEWLLGQEITIDKLGSFSKKLADIHPYCRIFVKDYATAEHHYTSPMRYKLRAYFCLSVIMECSYQKFYKRLEKQLTFANSSAFNCDK